MNEIDPRLSGRTLQIGELAKLAKLSVRALRHYDDIGLLTPSGRTEGNYRFYTGDDVLRLQQIMIQRELGFSLADIQQQLDDPSFNRLEAVKRQRTHLQQQLDDAVRILRSVDDTIAMLERGAPENDMTTNDETVQKLFDGFDPAEHEAEAEARWGNTEAFAESKRRTKRYTPADWARHKAELASILDDAAALVSAGVGPDDARAVAVAERHRLSIDTWFYPCDLEMHARLADMWEADTRFKDTMDKAGEGVTALLAATVRGRLRG